MNIKQIKHDFQSYLENLSAAFEIHCNEEKSLIDPDDSKEVAKTLEKIQDLWKKLEELKK